MMCVLYVSEGEARKNWKKLKKLLVRPNSVVRGMEQKNRSIIFYERLI
jgi:hypothetical protein